MELKVNSEIQYTCATGTRRAKIVNIHIGPTAKPGFLQTWLTLAVAKQDGVKFNHRVQIPASDDCIKAFRIQPL